MPESTLTVRPAVVSDAGRRHEIDVAGRGLWFEFSEPVAAPADAATVAVFPWALAHADHLHVDGPVSRTLLAGLEEWRDYWSMWRPGRYRRTVLTAAEVVDDEPGPWSAVAAFSGGVDATYQLIANATGRLGHRTLPLAAAVLVHGFDVPHDDVAGFAAATRRAAEVVEAFGVPLVTVRTNLREFVPDWEDGHGAAVAAVLHHFTDRAGFGLLAADEPYILEPHPWGSTSSTNHLLGSGRLRVRSDGHGVTRTEKCAVLAGHPVVTRNLRVCWEGPRLGENCGRCEKCVRTKLNFAAAGAGSVEALGPVTVAEAAGLRARNAIQMAYLVELREGLPRYLGAAVRFALVASHARAAGDRVRSRRRRL